MGRPPLPIGAHGKITTKEIGPKLHEARCRVKDRDGEMLQVRRTGATKTAAENACLERATQLGAQILSGQLTSDVRVKVVIEAWLDELEEQAAIGSFSYDSLRTYKSVVKNHTRSLSALRMGTEVKGSTLHKLVMRTHAKVGYQTAVSLRSVLRGICAYAMREDLISTDPSKSIGRIVRGDDQDPIRSLTKVERDDLLTKLDTLADARQVDSLGRRLGASREGVWQRLPDLVRALLCTGVRTGEVLALIGSSVVRDEETGEPIIVVDGHVGREKGEMVRKRYRKNSKKNLRLQVPKWSWPMWWRLKLAAGEGPMFPTSRGNWMHTDQIGGLIRDAFDACGYAWVTATHFRKTVGTVLAEANLPSRVVADQLGHANEATSRRFYVAPVANAAAVPVLETLEPTPPESAEQKE